MLFFMDAVTLSRIQFGLNISFHYIFPQLSVGLGLLLILMEGCFLWTKNPIYETITKFWVKIFALIFAVGVATGLVMVFAFGNTWSIFSRYVGDVFGSILGAEGIFAFFMESGFLGILLFGWKRVGPKMHFFSTIMVALGAHFSAVWIVIANSWMQTPSGHKIIRMNGMERAVIDNFWEVLFNPSSLDRLCHVILGCWLSGAFLVISVSAFYLLKKRYLEFSLKTMKIALIVASITLLLQLISGDSTARGVAIQQPVKMAAFEGIYKTEKEGGTGLYLFGWVDPKKEKVTGVEIPKALSFLVYRNFTEPVRGLDFVPKELTPNVSVVFQTYHLMIFMWVFMVIGAGLAWIMLYKRKNGHKFTLRLLIFSVIFPQIANQAGWFSAEMGRQPWVVYGLLKTAEATSPTVKRGEIIASLVMFSLIYLLIFILFIYLLDKKIRAGPPEIVESDEYRDVFAEKGRVGFGA